eukprot:scaffold7837_cov89-Isochrysis_galbana.AAC.4
MCLPRFTARDRSPSATAGGERTRHSARRSRNEYKHDGNSPTTLVPGRQGALGLLPRHAGWLALASFPVDELL